MTAPNNSLLSSTICQAEGGGKLADPKLQCNLKETALKTRCLISVICGIIGYALGQYGIFTSDPICAFSGGATLCMAMLGKRGILHLRQNTVETLVETRSLAMSIYAISAIFTVRGIWTLNPKHVFCSYIMMFSAVNGYDIF